MNYWSHHKFALYKEGIKRVSSTEIIRDWEMFVCCVNWKAILQCLAFGFLD